MPKLPETQPLSKSVSQTTEVRGAGNSTSRHRSKSRDLQGWGRSLDAGHRDKRAVDLNEQFESIAFKSIEADAIDPSKRNNEKDEVFVNVNMDLHTKSTQGWTQKRKETLFFQIVSICFLRIYRRMVFLSMERSHTPLQYCQLFVVPSLDHMERPGIACEFWGRKSVATFFVTEAEGPKPERATPEPGKPPQ